jgi:hypothetical protein
MNEGDGIGTLPSATDGEYLRLLPARNQPRICGHERYLDTHFQAIAKHGPEETCDDFGGRISFQLIPKGTRNAREGVDAR